MHLTEQQINAFVDDALDVRDTESVAAHLQSCAECSAEVEALRVVLARVRTLAPSIAPDRDLRPGIWAAADHKTLWHWRYPLSAAAILLIAITSTITVLVTRNEGGPVVHVTETTATVDLVSLENQYGREVEEMERTLREQRAALAPETVKILEENLAIIDKAIQEARTALMNDPQSNMLGELLRSAYQRKLDLLKQAARSSAAT
jgi:hypothetical protein